MEHEGEVGIVAELLYQRARREAQQIRRATPIGTRGLRDLVHLADNWGASVSIDPMEPGLSGFIIKDAGTEARIYINANDSPERQRFTLAHEIGHLVERSSLARDDDYSFMDYRDTQGKYTLQEFFADEFAGELLMPAGPLIRRVREEGEYSAAQHFGVSVPAVRTRMRRLAKNPPVAAAR